MNKRVVTIDFDGVIHSYVSGWQGADVVSDPPVKDAFRALANYVEHFVVCIYSSRSKEIGGIEAMQNWFRKWGLAPFILEQLEFPVQKTPAFLTIDDRAVCFDGNWPSPKRIKQFSPWFKFDPNELRPCPFCGSADVKLKSYQRERIKAPAQWVFYGFCTLCKSQGPKTSKSNAVHMWNKRSLGQKRRDVKRRTDQY